MRNQQPGVPQPHQRQQQGLNDVQLWQQHLMYKQLQELQRRQQLQQLDQEAREQSSLSQLTAITKQAAADQLPALVNGAPVHDSSNHMWHGDLMAGDSKIPSSSQMFMVGNMNWGQRGGSPAMHGFPNGLMLSQDQSQALRTMGLVSQQLDQSLYGAPVASTRDSLNQYPQFQGISRDGADMLMKASGNQPEKLVLQSAAFNSFQNDHSSVFPDQFCLQDAVSVSKQGFQGKNLLGQVPLQALNNGILSGNFQQLNSLPRNATTQEFQRREERTGWAGTLQQKAATTVGPSQGVVNLDPTEEKILFNDDGIWDTSFGRTGAVGTTGSLQGNQLEGTDYLNVFPSVQSGSWSALMQSAVAETSSGDTGLQDEWNGLSFQKMEGSTGNHPSGNEGKQTTTWVDNNLQAASSLTSRPFPLFDDANMSPSGHAVAGFQQPRTKFSFEHSERVRNGSSNDILQQSPKDSAKWLDQGSQQKPLLEGNVQVQTPMLESASEGVWARRSYEQSRNAGNSDVELNLQNMPDSWAQQQSATSYNIGNQSYSKANGWNMNETLSPCVDGTSKICDSESPVQHAQSNERNRAMHVGRDHDGGMWKSTDNRVPVSFPSSIAVVERVKSGVDSPQIHTKDSCMGNFTALPNSSSSKNNQEMNQQVLNSNHLDYGKHAILDSSVKYRGNEHVRKYQHQQSMSQVQESSMNNSDRVSGETYDISQENSLQKEISNDSYASGNPRPGHRSVTGGNMIDNAWFGSNDSHPLGIGNQESAGLVGQKPSGVRRFQYHPMGNVGVNREDSDTTRLGMQPEALSQAVSRVPKSPEQGYFGQSRFIDQAISKSTMDVDKRNGKGGEEGPSRSFHPGYDTAISAVFDGSAAFQALKRTGQTSQNMLDLLHKVDQSRENTVTRIGLSDENLSDVAEAAASDASIAHQQRSYSSASQGFGLRLAPPSQRLSMPSHVLSSQATSQAFNDPNSSRIDPELGDRGQTWMTASSVQSLPSNHEVSQREYWDNKSSMSGQTGNETSHSNIRGNSTVTSVISYPKNQQRHLLNASGQTANNHSIGLSFGSQPDVKANSKLVNHFRQTQDSHDGALMDQSAQVSFSGVASRVSPFNLGPHAESHLGIASSQSYSIGTGHSQPGNTNPSYQRNSGQDPVSHPPVTSGTPQQGAFSTMLHNAWTNIPAQQCSSGTAPHKVPHVILQSIGPLTNNLDPNSWTPKKNDDQSLKNGGNGPSKFGAFTINSQQFTYGEEQMGKYNSVEQQSSERVDLASQTDVAAQGREPVANHLGDTNRTASNKLIHAHQQDHGKGKHGQEPPLVAQAEHISLRSGSTSNHEIETFGHSLKPSEVLRQNYSLLHQMQAMKGSEIDPCRKGLKRPRGAESDGDAQQMTTKTGQQFLYGSNSMARDATDDELNAASRHASQSSDAKMLCFSSEGKDDQDVNRSSQFHYKDLPSYDQNHTSHHVIASTPPTRGTEHANIDPHMAPSWFEQYGTYKNGQILAMYDGLDSSRRAAKAAAQQFFFGKASDSAPHSTGERASAGDPSHVPSAWKTPTKVVNASEYFPSPQPLPPVAVEQGLAIVRPKKRKTVTSVLRPWHKEIAQGSERLQNIRLAERDWARAANRLIEKVEDEADLIDDVPVMPRPRRRLILTTQLMQQLLRSIPSAILSAEARFQYQSVTYFTAKLALGDACSSLVSCSASDDTHVTSNNRNMLSENLKSSERVGNQFFSKAVEDFIGRAKQLENELLRLDKRASILDVRVECQDLDKFAMINRFARFHGRSNADGAESSSSEASARKTFPRRYVTALSVPRNLPEGVLCLSL